MTYTTTPRPDALLTAIRTRATNQNRRIRDLEDQNRQLREQVERLQSLVRDQDDAIRAMRDLRRRWRTETK